MKPQEDEIAQHYAVKTVENICSQGGDWASKFANTDVAFNLIQIYNSGRGENLKATTASTLSRLLRYAAPSVVSSSCGCWSAYRIVQHYSKGNGTHFSTYARRPLLHMCVMLAPQVLAKAAARSRASSCRSTQPHQETAWFANLVMY